MGHLVEGFCHTTKQAARVHLADLMQYSSSAQVGYALDFGGVLLRYNTQQPQGSAGPGLDQYDGSGAGNSSRFMWQLTDVTGLVPAPANSFLGVSGWNSATFPYCDETVYGDQFMPWASGGSSAGVWDGPYTLELLGELWLVIFGLLGFAWVGRQCARFFT